MILANSIIDVCDDIEVRVHLRNQLHVCGLSRIIEVIIITLLMKLIIINGPCINQSDILLEN